MGKKIFLGGILSLLIIMAGCATKSFEPYNPDPIVFEETEKYSLDTESLDVVFEDNMTTIVANVQYAYIDSDTGVVTLLENPENSNAVLFLDKDYKAVAGLSEIALAYKDISKEQEALVNVYINQINALKELSMMEREKVKVYRDLWVSSENMYRQEHRVHVRENIINKSLLYISNIGWVLALTIL